MEQVDLVSPIFPSVGKEGLGVSPEGRWVPDPVFTLFSISMVVV